VIGDRLRGARVDDGSIAADRRDERARVRPLIDVGLLRVATVVGEQEQLVVARCEAASVADERHATVDRAGQARVPVALLD
jgi:hypothetical protein